MRVWKGMLFDTVWVMWLKGEHTLVPSRPLLRVALGCPNVTALARGGLGKVSHLVDVAASSGCNGGANSRPGHTGDRKQLGSRAVALARSRH